MSIVSKPLTNNAYGFPRGRTRRVQPVALACIHITGNLATSRNPDPWDAVMDEWRYANRSTSDGPSAHVYIARNGDAIEAIDPVKYAAWSNGDVDRPNLDNPGIRKVLSLRAKGHNANEGYWEEIECVGHPSGYRITQAQKIAVAERIRRRAAITGLRITRETVHGHWEINGVDRQNCPDRDHESFLNDIIALATGSQEDPMNPFPIGVDPKIIDIRVGAQLYNLDLGTTDAPKVSNAVGVDSPYTYRTGGVTYRLAVVPTSNVNHLWLVKPGDITNISPVPEPTPPSPTPSTYSVTVGGKPAGSVVLP